MLELSWRHQTLIQALLSRGPLRVEEFHSIFTALTGKNSGAHKQLFDEFTMFSVSYGASETNMMDGFTMGWSIIFLTNSPSWERNIWLPKLLSSRQLKVINKLWMAFPFHISELREDSSSSMQ